VAARAGTGDVGLEGGRANTAGGVFGMELRCWGGGVNNAPVWAVALGAVAELGRCPGVLYCFGEFGEAEGSICVCSASPLRGVSSPVHFGPSFGRRDSVDPLFLSDRVERRSSSSLASSIWRRAI
jgi:hypothetical protein